WLPMAAQVAEIVVSAAGMLTTLALLVGGAPLSKSLGANLYTTIRDPGIWIILSGFLYAGLAGHLLRLARAKQKAPQPPTHPQPSTPASVAQTLPPASQTLPPAPTQPPAGGPRPGVAFSVAVSPSGGGVAAS